MLPEHTVRIEKLMRDRPADAHECRFASKTSSKSWVMP